MKHSYKRIGSTVGLLCVLGCSGGPDGSAGGNDESQADGLGGKTGSGSHANANTNTNGGAAGGKNSNAQSGANTANNGAAGSGDDASAGADTQGTAGAGYTHDPPPAVGGNGSTIDPPSIAGSTAVGGNGSTIDPPAVGGTGNTVDPPNFAGSTAAGGTGNTVDPPIEGGTVSTGGTSGIGGTGSTVDPPGEGGTTASGGSNGEGGRGDVGGTSSVGGESGLGGASSVGGESGLGGASSVGGESGLGGTSSVGGESGLGGASSVGGESGLGGASSVGGESGLGGNTSVGGSTGTGGTPPTGGTTGNTPNCVMSEIDKINVVVFKDAAPSSADVEGRMWVGGDATFQSGGYSANSTGVAALKLTCDEYGVVVGGDLNGTLILGSGKAAYGGTRTGGFYSNANPQCGIFKAEPVDFPTLETNFKNYSAAFRDTPANGTVSLNWGSLVLVGTDPTLNVFSVTAAQLESTTEFRLSVPNDSAVVVNVSGTDILWKNGGFSMPGGGTSCRNGNSSWCHSILYNMYEAETVTLSGIGIQGSILAPYATVDGGNGNVDGQVVCEYLYGAIEYHPYFFTSCLQLPSR